MARYHINPETGEPGLCSATRACPFNSEHYDEASEARAAYELSQETFKEASARKGATPLKELDHVTLAQALLAESGLEGEELVSLRDAVALARVLHRRQTRKALINGRAGTPYIEHPLRNALRLVRLGVRTPEVLQASVLHDTAEDCAERFCEMNSLPVADEAEARREYLAYVEETFGERTAELVRSVTNPLWEGGFETAEEKNAAYRAVVVEKISRDPATLLIKWADVMDNGGSLYHAKPHELASARKQARKYLPTLQDFVWAIESHSSSYSREQYQVLLEKTLLVETRLHTLLATEGKN